MSDWTAEKVMKLAREGREKFKEAMNPDERDIPLETKLWFHIGVFVRSDRSDDYETILREAVLDFKSKVQAATRKEDMAAVCEGCREGWSFESDCEWHVSPDQGHHECGAQPIRELDQDALSDAKNRGDWR